MFSKVAISSSSSYYLSYWVRCNSVLNVSLGLADSSDVDELIRGRSDLTETSSPGQHDQDPLYHYESPYPILMTMQR